MRTTNPIKSLFGSSPFKPMQAHMLIVNECVAEVPGLFEALIAGNQEEVAAHKERIFAKEQEADDLDQQVNVHLPKSLFMPVDRRDLLQLLSVQDSIADTAQDIAGLMMERDMTVPEGMGEPLLALVNRCVDCCNFAANIIAELDELVEIGFRGIEADKVEDMIAELNKIEDETDNLGMDLVRVLFSKEDDIKPVSVMFWYQMIQWIGDLADHSEEVGNRMRLLIAR